MCVFCCPCYKQTNVICDSVCLLSGQYLPATASCEHSRQIPDSQNVPSMSAGSQTFHIQLQK